MQKFQTRTELVLYARTRVNSRACQQAFDSGKVQVLGGFSPLSPSICPGWLLRVTSKHKRSWLVAITTSSEALGEYGVWEADRIPWENWAGKPIRGPYNIFNGDDPVGSFKKKVECKHDGMDDNTGGGGVGQVVDRRSSDATDHLQLGQSELVED